MSRSTILILLGSFVFVAPFVGLPLAVLAYIFPLVGVGLAVIGITLRTRPPAAPLSEESHDKTERPYRFS